jgi:hypothetical protein
MILRLHGLQGYFVVALSVVCPPHNTLRPARLKNVQDIQNSALDRRGIDARKFCENLMGMYRSPQARYLAEEDLLNTLD